MIIFFLYPKDPYKVKYQLLIDIGDSTGLTHFNNSNAFINYSNDTYDIHKNIEEDNTNEKRKILIDFDDRIADMVSNRKLKPIVTE